MPKPTSLSRPDGKGGCKRGHACGCGWEFAGPAPVSVVASLPLNGPDEESELRCECGCLLARMSDGVIELRCRRCKRTIRVQVMSPAAQDRPDEESRRIEGG